MAWFGWFRREGSDLEMKLLHDLGNSLTCIKGYSQLLLSSHNNDKDALEKIEFCSQQAIGLMQDLMDQESLKRGDLSLRRKPVVIEDLIQRVAGGFDVICRGKGIKLRTRIESSGTLVLADSRRVSQVLSNLLSNAIRHTYSGGTITVSMLPQEDYARITVEDTGEGIPFEAQHKIFDKFYQSGANSGSMGLGLSICQEIVDRHEGQIGVTSAGAGRGSCFYFTLPFGTAAMPAAEVRGGTGRRSVIGGLAIAVAAACVFTFRAEISGLAVGAPAAPRFAADVLRNASPAKSEGVASVWPKPADEKTAVQSAPKPASSPEQPVQNSLYSADAVSRTYPRAKNERIVDSLAHLRSGLESRVAKSAMQFDGSVLQAKSAAVVVSGAWNSPKAQMNSYPQPDGPRSPALASQPVAPQSQTAEAPPVPDNIVLESAPENRWINPLLLFAGGIGIAGALMLGSSLQAGRKAAADQA